MPLPTKNKIVPHLLMLGACAIWGLMAPLGKHAMSNGIGAIVMVFLRVSGAAICLWITGFAIRKHKSSTQDIGLLAVAALLGTVFNQGLYTVGLSMTSPINATILTTTLPVFSLIIGILFFKRKINLKNGLGILLGLAGALFLILSSATGKISLFQGTVSGDLCAIGAQCSVALYLNIFQKLIRRNSALFVQKWMMTFSSFYILPFAWQGLTETAWTGLSLQVIGEILFVVVCSTFIANILMTQAQKTLQPTTVAMYNYVQPIVACTATLAMGIGNFGLAHAVAAILVFTGVYMVTRSDSDQTGKM